MLESPALFTYSYPQQLSTAGDKPVDKDPAVGRVAVADKAGGGGLPSHKVRPTPDSEFQRGRVLYSPTKNIC